MSDDGKDVYNLSLTITIRSVEENWFLFIAELEFPSSLTATERAYIHRLVQSMGFKSKSRG